MKEPLTLIKVGGKIVEEPASLAALLEAFTAIEGHRVLVHGGGRSATRLAAQLGLESRMVGGRRVTDAQTLRVVTMVYGGLVNKQIVAALQARGVTALGLTGADMDVIRSVRRPVVEVDCGPGVGVQPVDFGYVGDVEAVDGQMLSTLIDRGVVPVLAPLTHDGHGQLLNTNADTIAGSAARALAPLYRVTLVYCFEKAGVLRDEGDATSVIPQIDEALFRRLVREGVVSGGMIPKIENALGAIRAGVERVVITSASALGSGGGTVIS